MLRDKNLTTREHTVQATRAMAYERMAAAAGNDIGGEAMAAEASKYMLQLLEAEKYFLRQERGAVPPHLVPGLDLRSNDLDISALPGLFKFWLYRKGASVMGPGAWERWTHIMTSQKQTPPLTDFSLDGVPIEFSLPEHSDNSKFRKGEHPLVASWLTFSWQCVLDEVDKRFGQDHHICLHLPVRSASKATGSDAAQGLAKHMSGQGKAPVVKELFVRTMRQVCERLHRKPEDSAGQELADWRTELDALHGHEPMSVQTMSSGT